MNETEDELAKSLKSMLEQAASVDGAKHVLALLFPKAERILKTYLPSDYASPGTQKRAKRISDQDSATSYFRLEPRRPSWSKAEIEALLNVKEPKEAFELVSDRINAAAAPDQSRLRSTFLEMLDGAFGPGRPFTESWLRAILDF
jgi:hypothetical protein